MSLLILVSVCATAQKDTKDEQGKAENFIKKKGSIIEKTDVQVAKISSGSGMFAQNTPIYVLKIKDLLKNDSIYCVRMTATSTSGSTTDGYIDAEELPNVIQFLKLISEKYISQGPPASDIEVRYRCESGFELGCFKNSKGSWSIFISPKYYGVANLFLEKEALKSLYEGLKKADDYIKQKN